MRIGIVLHPYNEEKQSGLGRYIFNLTKNILEQDKNNDNYYFIFVKNKINKEIKLPGNNWEIVEIDKRFFWLDRGLWKRNLDVCLFSTPVLPFFVNFKKSIIVIHDLGYKYFKQNKLKTSLINFLMSFIYKFSLKKATNIVAVSNQTKNDLLKNFKISEKKVKVIYNGCNDMSSFEESYVDLPEEFFVFVGPLKPRKNVLFLAKAFCRFKKETNNDTKLVIIGSGEGSYKRKIVDFVKEEGLEKDIIFKGYLSDEEVSFVYKKAIAFIYPSLYEGFGMTVLEASSCGLPTIISDIPVFREVFGESSLFFDTQNIDSLVDSINTIYSNEETRGKLSKKSILLSRKYSWENSASEFIKLFYE